MPFYHFVVKLSLYWINIDSTCLCIYKNIVIKLESIDT